MINASYIQKEKVRITCHLFVEKNILRYYSEFQNEFIWYMPELIKEKPGGRPRVLEHYLKDKIVIQDVAKRITATIDIQRYLVNDTLNVIHDVNSSIELEYILALLNSKLINSWFQSIFPEGLHIKINQLQQIPIRTIPLNEQKQYKIFANQQLTLNSQLYKKKNKFLKRIQDNLGVEKVSKKLAAFYDRDFKTFIAELKKKKITLSPRRPTR